MTCTSTHFSLLLAVNGVLYNKAVEEGSDEKPDSILFVFG